MTRRVWNPSVWAAVLLLASGVFAARAQNEPAEPEQEPTVLMGEPLPRKADPAPSPAAAQMLESMREKGLLTEEEYEELYRRQARYEAERADEEGMPGWAKNWTFGGDMRLRYERRDFGSLSFLDPRDSEDATPGHGYIPGEDNILIDVDDPARGEGLGIQDRLRLRLRLGAEKLVTEDFTFGFRISTSAPSEFGGFFDAGGENHYEQAFASDPRSENVSFGDLFALESVFFDRAYLRWNPSFAPTLSVVAGKFANPFVSDYFDGDFLVWDNDIQPEGAAIGYRFDFSEDRLWFEGNAAAFWVDEVASITVSFDSTDGVAWASLPDPDDKDAYLWGVQGGVHGKPVEWLQLGARVSYYDFAHIGTRTAAALEDFGNGGSAIDNNPLYVLIDPNNPTAGREATDGSASGVVRELVVDGYADFTPWGEKYRITPFVQWMTLLTADTEDNGFGVGVTLGSPELLKLTAMYARIQRNATFSIFTDSDLFEGFTNAKGWYVALERQLVRGIRLRGAFMHSEQAEEECEQAGSNAPPGPSGESALCDTASQIPNLSAFRQTTLDRYRWQLDLVVDF